jgi:hypothetical protein
MARVMFGLGKVNFSIRIRVIISFLQ